jgi:Ca2+-binding EF-hand superfamily protein
MMTAESAFTADQRENFKNAFDSFDADGSGSVSAQSLGTLLSGLGFNPRPEDLHDILEDIAAPAFDYDTFLSIVYRHARANNPEGGLLAGLRLAAKGAEKLNAKAIRQILSGLKQPWMEQQIDQLLTAGNIRGESEVTYDEFLYLLQEF